MTPNEIAQLAATVAQILKAQGMGAPGADDGAFNPRTGNKDFFFYQTQVASIAALALATSLVQIDADADFYCVALSYQASIAGAALTESTNVIPLVTVLITDTGSGRNLSNAPLPLPTIAGDGKRPYRLIRPRVFGASSTLQLNWTNFSAGTTYAPLSLVFHGYKKYLNVRT